MERRDRKGEPAGKTADATVVRVVDGDTAEMELHNGGDRGRALHRGRHPGVRGAGPAGRVLRQEGVAALRTGLIEGERVTLAFGDERRDVYDRLLAYVYLGDRFVNAELVRLGYARTLEIAPNTDHAEKFERLQQDAANAGRGPLGRMLIRRELEKPRYVWEFHLSASRQA